MHLFFNLYSDAILIALEFLPGVNVGGHSINTIRYADYRMLILDTLRKLQNLLLNVSKESEKKSINYNYN